VAQLTDADHRAITRAKQLASDEVPAIAHVAASAIAHYDEVTQWDDLARKSRAGRQGVPPVSQCDTESLASLKAARALATAANDAKAVNAR